MHIRAVLVAFTCSKLKERWSRDNLTRLHIAKVTRPSSDCPSSPWTEGGGSLALRFLRLPTPKLRKAAKILGPGRCPRTWSHSCKDFLRSVTIFFLAQSAPYLIALANSSWRTRQCCTRRKAPVAGQRHLSHASWIKCVLAELWKYRVRRFRSWHRCL